MQIKSKEEKTYYYKVVVNGRNELLADFTIRSSAVKIKVKNNSAIIIKTGRSGLLFPVFVIESKLLLQIK